MEQDLKTIFKAAITNYNRENITAKEKEEISKRIETMTTILISHYERVNDLESVNEIKIISEEFTKQRLDDLNNITPKGKGFFYRNWKKIAAGTLAAGLIFGLVKINSSNDKQTAAGMTVKANENANTNDKTYDENKFNKHPLEAKTQIETATAWGQLFADNGILDKENGTDMFTLTAISTTFASGHADAKEFKNQLALGKNFTSTDEIIEQNIETLRKGHEQIVFANKSVDYTNLMTRKKDVKLLNKFNKMFTDMSVNPTQEQKDNFNKEMDKFLSDMDSYSPLTIFLMYDYASEAIELQLMPWENINLFAKAIDECCEKDNVCSIDNKKELSAANTAESKRKVLLATEFKDLIKDDSHDHKDDENYSSYDEINKKVTANISKMTNKDIDLEKEATEAAEEMAHAKVDRTYGVKEKADPSEVLPDGTIDSGKTIVENNVGDKIEEPAKDSEGNIIDSDCDKDFEMGAKDALSDSYNNAYKNNDAYNQGWNSVKQNSVQVPDGSGTTDVKDNIFEKPVQVPDEPTNKPEESTPEQTPSDNTNSETTEVPENNVDNSNGNVGTTEEEVYDEGFLGDYAQGPDGEWYPIDFLNSHDYVDGQWVVKDANIGGRTLK